VANYVLKNGHALDYCGGSHALPYLASLVSASYLIQWWSACPFSYVSDFNSFGSLYFWKKKENYDFLFENKGLSHENRGLMIPNNNCWLLCQIIDKKYLMMTLGEGFSG
jgi:hypothetical protein